MNPFTRRPDTSSTTAAPAGDVGQALDVDELAQADELDAGAGELVRVFDQAADQAVELRPGDVVCVTWLDTATQADVDRYGVVVDVEAGCARVGYLGDVTGPIPVTVEDGARPDQPRIRRLGA